MTWTLILLFTASATNVQGFHDDYACKSAGNAIVQDLGKKEVQFWCVKTKGLRRK